MIKRIFAIVLDSLGIGALPDAGDFSDPETVHTLRAVYESGACQIPNLISLGLGAIKGAGVPASDHPRASFGRMHQRSAGKDTVTGHHELAGVISPRPLPTYPCGFPADLMAEIDAATGIGHLCNRPYSGTEVLKDYGEEMMRTGKVIVYTSADSVFQVAAHEDILSREALYAYCEKARAILSGEHRVGRVIARPFIGSAREGFTRTAGRHDYALDPSGITMLDLIREQGKEVIGIGKIADIFNHRSITRHIPTACNAEGMTRLNEMAATDFEGLCFANLVDFDMLYGHRRDAMGYGRALSEFDLWLGGFLADMKETDALIITADHGCDPTAPGTDHTREAVPLLIYSPSLPVRDLGTLDCFGDMGATVCALLGIDPAPLSGKDHSLRLYTGITPETLLEGALAVMEHAYAPYSGFKVGAALLCEDGEIYYGCNLENAAFSDTLCAERGAIAAAIADGKRSFLALLVAGGKDGVITSPTYPCGSCRQVLRELCPPSMPIYTVNREGTLEMHRLSALLPFGFDSTAFKE